MTITNINQVPSQGSVNLRSRITPAFSTAQKTYTFIPTTRPVHNRFVCYVRSTAQYWYNTIDTVAGITSPQAWTRSVATSSAVALRYLVNRNEVILFSESTTQPPALAYGGVPSTDYAYAVGYSQTDLNRLSDVLPGPRTDATLSSLTSSPAGLTLQQNTLTVDPGDTSITLTFATNQAGASVSPASPASFDLVGGDNTLALVVTAANGTTTQRYEFTVTLPVPTGDANNVELLTLTSVPEGLTQNNFALTVPAATDSITLRFRLNNTGATARPASPITQQLAVGANEIIIAVNSANNERTRAYRYTITRTAPTLSSDNALTALRSEPPGLTLAQDDATFTAKQIRLIPTLPAGATTLPSPAVYTLNPGRNDITLTVVAQDGTERAYTYTARYAAPSALESKTYQYPPDVTAGNIKQIVLPDGTTDAEAQAAARRLYERLSQNARTVNITVSPNSEAQRAELERLQLNSVISFLYEDKQVVGIVRSLSYNIGKQWSLAIAIEVRG